MSKLSTKSATVLDSIHRLDALMFLWMMKRKHLRTLTKLCRLLSRTADGFWYVPLALILWYHNGPAGSLFALTLVLAFAMERPLYFILKQGLRRNRPASALPGYESFIIPSDRFSFPSGHTSGAFLVATALIIHFPAVGFLVYCWATLVGFARVTLGVHFPTDAAVGAAMGSGLALLAAHWIGP